MLSLDTICFNNLKDYWKSLANTEPSVVTETAHAISIGLGLGQDMPPVFNPVFLDKDTNTLPELPYIGKHGFWYDRTRNAHFPSSRLQAMDLILEPVPMMAISLDRAFSIILPSDITLRTLDKKEDLTSWMRPLKIAFDLTDSQANCYQRALEGASEKLLHYEALKNGQIIGVASLFLHHEIAGLYNLAVLPEFRKQGIGTALFAACLTYTKNMGYAYSTLQSSPMATALYKRMGFETLSEISIYRC